MGDRTLITTVVAPATAAAPLGGYDLTTLAVIKSELGKTDNADDGVLQRFITGASGAVKNYCNRVFQVETVKDEFWPQRDPSPRVICGGLSPLHLSRYPLVSVATVIENDITLTVTTDFRIDYARGQLIRVGGDGFPRSWPAYALSAQYNAGFAAIPDDVADAVVRMVKQRWLAKGRDSLVRQENIPGVREVQYWIATGAEAGNMPPDVIDILDNYRVPVVSA